MVRFGYLAGSSQRSLEHSGPEFDIAVVDVGARLWDATCAVAYHKDEFFVFILPRRLVMLVVLRGRINCSFVSFP